MANYTWRALSGAFSDAGNWDLGSVPGAMDAALFVVNGGAISGTGNVSAMSFASFAWLVTGQLQADAAAVGNNGALTVASNGQLVLNGSFAASSAAVAVGSNGLLEVTGGGPGTFTGASLTLSGGGSAVLTGPVTFSGSNATVDAALLTVGGIFQLGTASGGAGSLSVQNRGLVAFTAPVDFYNVYVQLGAVAGSNVAASVSGAGSQIVATNTTAVGGAGGGSLAISAGGAARFTSPYNAASPAQRSAVGGTTGTIALLIGQFSTGAGAVTVSGSGSTLAANGSVIVGGSGRGSLLVVGGATATSSAAIPAQAALAIAAGAGSSGSVTVSGTGSVLSASGLVVVGGDNRGAGLSGGGAGTLNAAGGGSLQTGSMTVLAGSSVGIDGASSAAIAGDLYDAGTVSSGGTLAVSGTVYGGGTVQLAGGLASLGALQNATIALTSNAVLLRVGALSGASSLSGFQSGDVVDLVGQAAAISGNTVSSGGGTLNLAAAPGGLQYELQSDGAGGTLISLGADTIGVYRFFDSNYGTHFFSSSPVEKNNIVDTRPDLVYEGVGLQAIDPSSPDPNAAPVYRFFDETYGTHFFTASTAERDAVIANRPDLAYEGVGFVEHTTQQAGDTPVFRFFDTRYGTHFYTADATEKASIAATRPDLVYEGIGFYAPS